MRCRTTCVTTSTSKANSFCSNKVNDNFRVEGNRDAGRIGGGFLRLFLKT